MRWIQVSVHDVTPAHRKRLERADRLLGELGVGSRYTMLVVPDYHGRWPLEEHPEFVAWLRERRGAGVEMVLHGYDHSDRTRHESFRARWLATRLTSGEGEFLGLDRDEARRRLERGRDLLEARLGGPVEGFVAPAWLYGEPARQALADLGFKVAEDHFRVWSPASGRLLARSPVVAYASRTRSRQASSILWSRIATVVLRPWRGARFAIHPRDLDVPCLEREIRRALRALLRGRRLVALRDL